MIGPAVFSSRSFDGKKALATLNINYVKNRKTNKGNIDVITDDLINDEYYPYTAIVFANVLDKNGKVVETIMTNGQHTMEAIINASNVVPNFKITLQISTFTVENAEDLAMLFSKFDSGKRRTENDYLATTDLADKKFTGTTLNIVSSAASFNLNHKQLSYDGTKKPATGVKREAFIYKHEATIDVYLNIVAKCNNKSYTAMQSKEALSLQKYLKKAPIFSIFITAMAHNPIVATKFISKLISAAPTGAALSLRLWLGDNGQLHGGGEQRALAVAIAHYFNLHAKGKNDTTNHGIDFFKDKVTDLLRIVGYNSGVKIKKSTKKRKLAPLKKKAA